MIVVIILFMQKPRILPEMVMRDGAIDILLFLSVQKRTYGETLPIARLVTVENLNQKKSNKGISYEL